MKKLKQTKQFKKDLKQMTRGDISAMIYLRERYSISDLFYPDFTSLRFWRWCGIRW